MINYYFSTTRENPAIISYFVSLITASKRTTKNRDLNHEGKTVLYITNLVRPFTVNQLRELLLRTGRIVEDGFWIDSIKSKCYVQVSVPKNFLFIYFRITKRQNSDFVMALV